MRAPWLTLILAICAVLVVPATTAQAQGAPDFDAAKRHYLAAREANSKADYDTAIREFILAYDITKDPSLFKQIAQSYEAAGKKTEAAVYYRRYLSEGKNGPDTDDVKARIAALEGAAAPPTSPPVEEPAPLPPEPPPSTVKPSAPPLDVPPPSMIQDSGSSWQRTMAWVSVGLAAAAATTGAVLVTSSMSREEDIQRLIDFRDPATGLPRVFTGSVMEDYLDKRDQGKSLSQYGTIAFIGAGGFAGLAVLFFILDATRDVESSKPATTQITPSVSPDSFGLTVGWSL